MASSNYLDATDEEPKLKFFENLIGDNNEVENIFKTSALMPSRQIYPTHGVCIKAKEVSGEKLFVNICHCDDIPEPPPITEEELCKQCEREEDSEYRIPMSLGQLHRELDKNGSPCLAFDVVVNSSWFKTHVCKSISFFSFLVTAAMEGIESKYKLGIVQQGWIKLKNRKFFGTMPQHFIQDRTSASSHLSQSDQELKLPNSGPSRKPMIEDITGKYPMSKKLNSKTNSKINKISSNDTLNSITSSISLDNNSELTLFPNSTSSEGEKPKIVEMPLNTKNNNASKINKTSKTFYEDDSPPVVVYSKSTSKVEKFALQSENEGFVKSAPFLDYERYEKQFSKEIRSIPKYEHFKYPVKGYPQFLRYLIYLPKLKIFEKLYLYISLNNLKLTSLSYHLELDLPYLVIRDEASSFFNKATKILSVTLPIIPSSKR